MTYAMIPDELLDRLEEAGLSRDDRLLYLELHVHAARLLTDGWIRARLGKVTDHPDPQTGIATLIAAGLVVRDGDALRLPDFLRTNHARTTIEAMRAKSRERTERHRRHIKGDHSMCDPTKCQDLKEDARNVTDDVTERVSGAVSHGALSDPIRSDPKESGEDQIEGDDGPAEEPATAPSAITQALPGTCRYVADPVTGWCSACGYPQANARHRSRKAA